VGVVTPDEAEAHTSLITITGPNSDATFLTILGIDEDGNVVRERLEMDGSSPSVITSTNLYRQLTSIFVGEATNAAEFDLTAGPDVATLALGYVLRGATRGQMAAVALLGTPALTNPLALLGALHVNLLDGQNGGSDPTYDLTGIEVGDELVFVGHFTTKASIASHVDVTSSFSVTDADEISAVTDFTNDQLMVIWVDRTP
jgi:hypothetical protein